MSKAEQQTRLDFAEWYSLTRSRVEDEIEQRVIGAVWGANGFTTLAQADLLCDRLSLSSEKRLLDVGTGRGWPGLYMAKKTGCEVTLTDLPIEGLRFARKRADEGVRLVGSAVASAARLPFREASFDAIVHTDVLC
jgi:2-polyprenyl-3-methyl-5-hydroxy-6-metoxy-1,4-benzoquinol methylase